VRRDEYALSIFVPSGLICIYPFAAFLIAPTLNLFVRLFPPFRLVITHVGLWWKVYAQQGTFPHDIFAIPMEYHSDNFTVPLAVLGTIGMLSKCELCIQYILRVYLVHAVPV
jgi:hypothetical protein